jgi:hypothetical protein
MTPDYMPELFNISDSFLGNVSPIVSSSFYELFVTILTSFCVVFIDIWYSNQSKLPVSKPKISIL